MHWRVDSATLPQAICSYRWPSTVREAYHKAVWGIITLTHIAAANTTNIQSTCYNQEQGFATFVLEEKYTSNIGGSGSKKYLCFFPEHIQLPKVCAWWSVSNNKLQRLHVMNLACCFVWAWACVPLVYIYPYVALVLRTWSLRQVIQVIEILLL